MADHAPLPWRFDIVDPDGRRWIVDTDINIVARVGPTDGDRQRPRESNEPDLPDRDANANLIVRAVNAVAGTQPGPVDLDVALCLADQALMGDFPAVGEAIQALVGEVVRLRDCQESWIDLAGQGAREIVRLTNQRGNRVVDAIVRAVDAARRAELFPDSRP